MEFRESPLVSIHAEASSNGLSESRRQSQSELRPHQISHPGVTPHSRHPGSDGCGWMNSAPSSTTLLYHTLVQDGAVPSGFQQEFETLAPAIRAGTARQARKAACTSEFDAALILHEMSEELKHKVRLDKSVADKLVQAATARPRKHRARYLSAQFQGPTARKDAEDSERNRWTTELADFLRGNPVADGSVLGLTARESAHRRRTTGEHPSVQSQRCQALPLLVGSAS